MNRKRTIIIILLLLLLGTAGYFLLCKKEKPVILPAASLQGSTAIDYGEISMNIWDNEAEDGDTVKVFLDGKLMKDSVELFNNPIALNFGKLKKGTHQLIVAAISEGINSPATATIGLSNGTEPKEFVMNATKDSAAAWTIIIK